MEQNITILSIVFVEFVEGMHTMPSPPLFQVHIIPFLFSKDGFVLSFSVTSWKTGPWHILSGYPPQRCPYGTSSCEGLFLSLMTRKLWGPPLQGHLLMVLHPVLVLWPSLPLLCPFLGCILLVHVILCVLSQSLLCEPSPL